MNDLLKRRFINIKASVFAGEDDENTSAYTGKKIDPNTPVVALPARIPPWLRHVRVFYRDKSIDCIVDDVGPHHTHDAYWQTEHGRPMNEKMDGIDMTPYIWDELGADQDLGHILVDWEFILPKKINGLTS